jgi:ubiquitin C-terminal hydrolase
MYNQKPKGLENIGATCYMNAVLQCFYNVKVLTEELKKYQIIPIMKMTWAYKDVINQLSSKESKPAVPTFFKNVISDNPLFKGVQANDCKDLILYFLEIIENELTFKNYFCQDNRYFNRIKYVRQTNDPELANILRIFDQCHKSIISDLFYGFKSQILECKICHLKLKNYQIFNLLIFPIEAVYNSNNSKQDNKTTIYSKRGMTSSSEYGSFYNGWNASYSNKTSIYGGKKKVTIEECFEYDTQDVVFNGENQIFCNKCRKLNDALCKNKIYSSPHVLILVLNRGKGNQFDCDVEFGENLNIKNYVERSECPTNYKLIGVISHLGESSMSGHFLADCRYFDGQWYCFNDSVVSGPSSHYSKKGTPYILFYQNSEL